MEGELTVWLSCSDPVPSTQAGSAALSRFRRNEHHRWPVLPTGQRARLALRERHRSNIVIESDKSLPENSKQNLDKKLDRAVEETFPTSDPVSVSITKGGATSYGDQGVAPSAPRTPAQQGTAEHLLDEAKEKLSAARSTVAEAAHDAYEQGSRYLRDTMDRYPQAERYYREGTEAVRREVAEYPLLTLFLGIGLGYAIAWAIHRSGGSEGVPDYARTRRAYYRED